MSRSTSLRLPWRQAEMRGVSPCPRLRRGCLGDLLRRNSTILTCSLSVALLEKTIFSCIFFLSPSFSLSLSLSLFITCKGVSVGTNQSILYLNQSLKNSNDCTVIQMCPYLLLVDQSICEDLERGRKSRGGREGRKRKGRVKWFIITPAVTTYP